MSGAFQEAMKSTGTVKVEPIPLRGERGEPQPYPVDQLGERMARAVRAIVKRVQLPDAIAAHSVLAAVAVAVQGHVVVEMPTKQRRPCSLFLATIADSGDRKTSADQLAMAPISDYELHLGAEYQREKLVHSSLFAVWKSAKDEIAKVHKDKGASFIAEEVRRHGDPPAEPLLPMVLVPPGSTQGVIWALEKGRPSIGLFLNEGGSWLGSWAMQDENRTATISAYSELWDGQPIKTLTKGDGLRYLPNRAFSFHVMFQPTYIETMFGDEEMRGQGFINRVLAAAPSTLAGTRLKIIGEAEPDWVADDLAEYQESLGRMIRSALPVDPENPSAGLANRRVAVFTPDAEALFWQFYNHVEAQQVKGGPLERVRGFAGKAVEHASRLAAVIHVFEHGLRDLAITGSDMLHGIELMSFYIEEAIRLSDAAGDDPMTRNAQALSDWLRDHWPHPEVGLRHIQRQAPRPIKTMKADEVRDLCAFLARNDHITSCPGGTVIDGSHCKEAWRVHVGR